MSTTTTAITMNELNKKYADALNSQVTSLKQVMMSNGLFDAHMWVELSDGRVVDYEDKSILTTDAARQWQATSIVRKPFKKGLQKKVRRAMLKNAKKRMKYLKKMCSSSAFEKEQMRWLIVPGHCNLRACFFMDVLAKRNDDARIVCGSLGYRLDTINRENYFHRCSGAKVGDVFYEYG